MHCPRCGILIDPVHHGDLVFDEQVWCQGCHQYDDRLLEVRPFPELESWAQMICAAWDQEPVYLQRDPDYLPDPAKYWHGTTFLLAEADHGSREIMLHPPGLRLLTLCHELAHLFTGQDHTEGWARTFAALTAWVKARL
ncbi:MAG: hypothetical protein ACOZF2_04955 [Thermodesulfobacteriota bacterium]